MHGTEKSVHCPECGRVAVLETRTDTVEYKGQTAAVRVKGHWCPKCGEVVLEGPALVKREQAFLALRAKVEGVLGPKEVAAIRERLKLLSGGPERFLVAGLGHFRNTSPANSR